MPKDIDDSIIKDSSYSELLASLGLESESNPNLPEFIQLGEEFSDSIPINHELETKLFGNTAKDEIRRGEIINIKNFIYEVVCKNLYGRYPIDFEKMPAKHVMDVKQYNRMRSGDLKIISSFFNKFDVINGSTIEIRMRSRRAISFEIQEFVDLFLNATRSLIIPSRET